MNQEYRSDREYSLLEVLKYNLRKWWLAAILAAVFGVLVGGYKAVTLRPYVDNEVYQDKTQVCASLLVHEYSSGSSVERGTNIMKLAASTRVYDEFCRITGLEPTHEEFCDMFESEQSESSDVVTFYVTFPHTSWEFTIEDENAAIVFMDGLLKAVDTVTQELMGQQCVSVIDEPHATREVEKQSVYTISQSDFRKGVLKAVTAGILLGIIVEVVCYTIWLMFYKKPKDAEEVKECLNTPVIDVINREKQDVETYKKVALFLAKGREGGCRKINCITVGRVQDSIALKLAMCYANEQKKTLYLDLNTPGDSQNSISGYVLGKEQTAEVQKMNDYLDALHRNVKEEGGFDLVGNSRFAELLNELAERYEYIVVNGRDASKMSESFETAILCDRNIVVCERRSIRTEALYTVKNTAEVNGIHLDGVLIYDL